MKINNIQIGAFGKLKNAMIDFADGFQIISEKNEYGKSTIMAFMKLMFYGKGTGSRDISINLRKKYAPWDGSKMSGAIEFTYHDTDYRLEKEFAKTASSDKTVIINKSSGEQIPLAKEEEAGMKFFQMDSNGFDKSIFIGTLGSFTGNGDKDSIAGKISNLTAAADEEISAELVMKRLKDAKEGLVSKSGKTGGLIKLREEIGAVQSNLNELVDAEKQREEEKLHYEKLKQNMRQEYHMLELVRYKIRMQKLEEVIECENNFRSLWRKLECLQVPYEKMQTFFAESGNLYITIQHDLNELKRLKGMQARNLKEQNSRELEELEKEVQSITQSLLYKKQEQNQLEQSLHIMEQERNKKKQKYQVLDEQIQSLKHKLNSFDVKKAEQKREYLHLQLLQSKQKKESITRNEGIHRNIITAAIWVMGLVILAFEIIWGAYPAFAATVILFTAGTVIGKRKKGMKRPVRKEQDDQEQEQLYEKIRKLDESIAIDRKMREQYVRQDVQLKLYAEQLEQDKDKQQQAGRRKEEIEQKIANEIKKKQEIMLRIQAIYQEAGCHSVEEYRKNYIENKALTEQKQKLEIKLAKQQKMFQNLFKDMKEEVPFSQYLKHYEEKKACFEEAVREKARYELLVKAYELEETNLDGQIEEQIRVQEKFERLKQKIQYQNPETHSLTEINHISDEQDMKLLNEYQEHFYKRAHMLEEAVHEAGEQLRPADQNPIAIERNLKDLKQTEAEMTQYYQAVCAADKMMEETVQQIRQSFGNELNNKTSEIFKQITGGKYENVIVNKDYGMLVSDQEDIRYREWKYLSSGTIDQLYLALRLAITECITEVGETLPLFLDDILAQYDEERASQTIRFLKELGRKHQIILFTCHDYFKKLMEAD